MVTMKLVQAIIKPNKLDDTKEALVALGVKGMTVTHVKGFGRQPGQTEVYRGAEYEVAYVSKIKIEVLIEDDLLPKVSKTIQLKARTGEIGDGKIFITHIEGVTRIRTGESGRDAI